MSSARTVDRDNNTIDTHNMHAYVCLCCNTRRSAMLSVGVSCPHPLNVSNKPGFFSDDSDAGWLGTRGVSPPGCRVRRMEANDKVFPDGTFL